MRIITVLILGIMTCRANADDTSIPIGPKPELTVADDTSRYEVSPSVRKIDFIKSGDVMRVLVKASGPIECYSEREIERIIEKDTVKVIMRLKKPSIKKDCPVTQLEYQEKVYESPIDQLPAKIWILGHEGWNKLEFANK